MKQEKVKLIKHCWHFAHARTVVLKYYCKINLPVINFNTILFDLLFKATLKVLISRSVATNQNICSNSMFYATSKYFVLKFWRTEVDAHTSCLEFHSSYVVVWFETQQKGDSLTFANLYLFENENDFWNFLFFFFHKLYHQYPRAQDSSSYSGLLFQSLKILWYRQKCDCRLKFI